MLITTNLYFKKQNNVVCNSINIGINLTEGLKGSILKTKYLYTQ